MDLLLSFIGSISHILPCHKPLSAPVMLAIRVSNENACSPLTQRFCIPRLKTTYGISEISCFNSKLLVHLKVQLLSTCILNYVIKATAF